MRSDKFSMFLFAVLENLVKILKVAGGDTDDEGDDDNKDVDVNHDELQDASDLVTSQSETHCSSQSTMT